MSKKSKQSNPSILDSVVAEAQRNRLQRESGYREKSLRMYPWICGRCAREFTRENVHELTVHHRDHNHDNNPQDGSNWELLCVYCHDNEHQRLVEVEKHVISAMLYRQVLQNHNNADLNQREVNSCKHQQLNF